MKKIFDKYYKSRKVKLSKNKLFFTVTEARLCILNSKILTISVTQTILFTPVTSVQLHSTYTIILLPAIYKAYLGFPNLIFFYFFFKLKFETFQIQTVHMIYFSLHFQPSRTITGYFSVIPRILWYSATWAWAASLWWWFEQI